jgi:hypothetical protein
MSRCTPASNPIVENCSQPAIWDTTFNATFTNSSITGEFIGQYWTWNTTSSGAITDCQLNYTYAAGFALNRVAPNTTSYYSISSSQKNNSGSGNPPSGNQGSSPSSSSSKTSNSSSTTNSTNTTTTKSGGTLKTLIYTAAAAAVLVVGVGVGVIFLRKKS